MNNACEICSTPCEGNLCPECQYRFDSKDSSDIRQRVQDFDNSIYERDEIKNAICNHFGIDPKDLAYNYCHGHKYAKARQLYIYISISRFKIKQCEIAREMKVAASRVVYICKELDKKWQNEFARKKFETILNIK